MKFPYLICILLNLIRFYSSCAAQDVYLDSQWITSSQFYEVQGNIGATSVTVDPGGELSLKASNEIHFSATAGRPFRVNASAKLTAAIIPHVNITPLPLSGNIRPVITSTISSPHRGINRSSLKVAFDSNVLTTPAAGTVSWTPLNSANGSGSLTFTTPSDLSVGAHTFRLSIGDKLGNSAVITINFNTSIVNFSGLNPWTINDLGSTTPHSINNQTQVVGQTLINTEGSANAFYWTEAGGQVVLDSYIGHDASNALMINASSVITGSARLWGNSLDSTGTVWLSNDHSSQYWLPSNLLDTMVHNEQPYHENLVQVYGVDSTGTRFCGVSNEGAVVWTGPFQEYWILGYGSLLPDGAGGGAFGINSSGDIAGYILNDVQKIPRIWKSSGVSQNLSLLSGHSQSSAVALAINTSCESVGYLTDNSITSSLYWSSSGAITKLADNSIACSINLSGTIVGYISVGNGSHAVMWNAQKQLVDLNDLLPVNSHWTLCEATCINDLNQIVGWGYHNNVRKGFLISPPQYPGWPEPPINLVASANSSSDVTLTWQHSRISTQKYIIERSDNNNQNFSVIGQVLNTLANPLVYMDRNLISNKNYFYRVKACIPDYESNPSNEASIRLDSLPNVTITTQTPYIDQNTGVGNFLISRTGNTANDLIVSILPHLGTGTDSYYTYSGLTSLDTVIIPAGSNSIEVRLTPISNSSTSDFTVVMAIAPGPNYLPISPKTAKITVISSVSPVLSVTTVKSAFVNNGTSYDVFRIHNDFPSLSSTLIAFTMSGEAKPGDDYSLCLAANFTNGPILAKSVQGNWSVLIQGEQSDTDVVIIPTLTNARSSSVTATMTLTDPLTSATPPSYYVTAPKSASSILSANAPLISISNISNTNSFTEGSNFQNCFTITMKDGAIPNSVLASLLEMQVTDLHGSVVQTLNAFIDLQLSPVQYDAATKISTVTVQLKSDNDQVYTGNVQITLSIKKPDVGGVVYRIGSKSAKILRKDIAPTFSVVVTQDTSSTDATVTPPVVNPAIITIVKEGTVPSGQSVYFTLDSVGTRGTDYALAVYDTSMHFIFGNSIVFPSNASKVTIYVYPLRALLSDIDVTLALNSDTAYGTGSPNQGTVTLLHSTITLPQLPQNPPNPLPPPPNCDKPLSASISNLKITGGTTGEDHGDFKIGNNTKPVSFTKNFAVTVSVNARATNGTIDKITITGGSDILIIQGNGAANGVFTGQVNVANEGIITLFASVSVTNPCGDAAGASLPDGQEMIVVVDRTPPSLVYTLPDRHSNTNFKELVYLNGSTRERNSALRADKRCNCWIAGDFKVAATINDLSGLKKLGNQGTISGKADTVDLNITVNDPTETQPNYTIDVDPPSDLTESIKFGVTTQVMTDVEEEDEYTYKPTLSDWKDPFKIDEINGFYHFDIQLEDRCGNKLDTSEDDDVKNLYSFRIWIDRTPPPAAFADNNLGGQADWRSAQDNQMSYGSGSPLFKITRAQIDHINETTFISSQNAWYIVSTYDAVEAWQADGIDGATPVNWMHVAYHHATNLDTLYTGLLTSGPGVALRTEWDALRAPAWLAKRGLPLMQQFANLADSRGPVRSSLSSRRSESSRLVGSLTPETNETQDDLLVRLFNIFIELDPYDEKNVIEAETTPFILRRPLTNLNGGIHDQDEWLHSVPSGCIEDWAINRGGYIWDALISDYYDYFHPDWVRGPLQTVEPTSLDVILRDAAGNYSDQGEHDSSADRLTTVRRDVNFVVEDFEVRDDIDGDGDPSNDPILGHYLAQPDMGPQFSDGSNYFDPKAMSVPPSFKKEDDSSNNDIAFTLNHPDYINIQADRNVDYEGNKIEDEHKCRNPLIGIAPPTFEPNGLLLGQYGLLFQAVLVNTGHTGLTGTWWPLFTNYFGVYRWPLNVNNTTDLFQIKPSTVGHDKSEGKIPYKRNALTPDMDRTIDRLITERKHSGKNPWSMKTDMQPGLARAMDTNVHTGYHWANVAKLTPDVVATGKVVTLRIGAGFIKADTFDEDGEVSEPGNQSDFINEDGSFKLPSENGSYIQIGNGLLVQSQGNTDDPKTIYDPTKITILRSENKLQQRLVPDGNEASLLQWIELTVNIGKDVSPDVYDVKVDCGNVIGLTMTGALNIIKLDWRDNNGSAAEYAKCSRLDLSAGKSVSSRSAAYIKSRALDDGSKFVGPTFDIEVIDRGSSADQSYDIVLVDADFDPKPLLADTHGQSMLAYQIKNSKIRDSGYNIRDGVLKKGTASKFQFIEARGLPDDIPKIRGIDSNRDPVIITIKAGDHLVVVKSNQSNVFAIVTALPVRLDMVKGDSTDDKLVISDDMKSVVGEVVPPYTALPSVDRFDLNMLILKVRAIKPNIKRKAPFKSIKLTLHYNDNKISVWKDDNQNVKVQDGAMLDPDKETTLYVSGKSPDQDTVGSEITLRLKLDGDVFGEDLVRVLVSNPIYACFGTGETGRVELIKYLDKWCKDGRVFPYILRGKSQNGNELYYGVYAPRFSNVARHKSSNDFMKAGLSFKDSFVVFDGHSNYGIGPKFTQLLPRLENFMHLGSPLVAIGGNYQNQEAPCVTDPRKIAGDAANYKIQIINILKFPNTNNIGENGMFFLKNGGGMPIVLSNDGPVNISNLRQLWHFAVDDPDAEDRKRLLVRVGSADLPTLRYKSFYFNACESGRYFFEVFQTGVLFYTQDVTNSATTTKLYIEGIVNGKSWVEIKDVLRTSDDVTNFYDFGK